jgi:hypothetical protein
MTRKENMSIDEMTNEQLEREGHSAFALEAEAGRIEQVITQNALTGADVSYFIERSRIVRDLIRHGVRDSRLP